MADVNDALKAAYQDGFYGRPVATNLYGAYLQKLWNADGSIYLTDSKNWQGVAILADALNNANGQPHLVSLAECFRWMTAYLKWQQVRGWMNHEQDSDIYARHHHGFVRGMRAIAMKKGQAELAGLCDAWLLVALVHAAVSRSTVPVRVLSDKARQPAPGPAVYVTTVPSPSYGHAMPGQREESTKNDGVISVDRGPEENIWLEAMQGIVQKNTYAVHLKLNGYAYDFGIDPATKSALIAASKRDLAALRVVLAKVAVVPCALECFIEWTTEGLNAWAPKLPGGSTLGKGVHIIREPSGEQVILLAGDGERDTGAADLDIGPSEATIDWASRTVKIRRTDTGATAGPAALAGGERIALITWGPKGHLLLKPAEVAPAPQPSPVPAPPEDLDAIRSLLCLSRGAVRADKSDDGMTFAPIAGSADMVLVMKGLTNNPFGFECNHLRADGLWIASESGLDGLMRYVWAKDGRPGGECWLPLSALRGEESDYAVNCWWAPTPGEFQARIRIRRVPPLIPGADWAITRQEEMGEPGNAAALEVETYWFEHLPEGIVPAGWRRTRGGVEQGTPWRAGATASFSPAIARILDTNGVDRWVSTNASLPVPANKPAPSTAARDAILAKLATVGTVAAGMGNCHAAPFDGVLGAAGSILTYGEAALLLAAGVALVGLVLYGFKHLRDLLDRPGDD